MRALLVAATATISALSTALPGSPAQAATTTDAYERQALDVTNDERTARDLRRLRADACLARFANRHATRMASQQRLFHQDLAPVRRRCDLTRVGENVAAGYRDGRTAVSVGWMSSPPHRANILSRPFRLVAIGAARSSTGHWYTAQVLGSR